MRSLSLALIIAFATATRLTAFEAADNSIRTADVKNADFKPLGAAEHKDDKNKDAAIKPIDIKAPGAEEKKDTLEATKEKSASFGDCAQTQIQCQEYQAVPAPVCPAFADLDCRCALPCVALGSATTAEYAGGSLAITEAHNE